MLHPEQGIANVCDMAFRRSSIFCFPLPQLNHVVEGQTQDHTHSRGQLQLDYDFHCHQQANEIIYRHFTIKYKCYQLIITIQN